MTRAEGIDVSSHQATTPSLRGLDFLIARATYGTRPDTKYKQHIAAARAAGLIVGAYHFGTAASPGATQAAAFLAAAGSVDLYILDLEKERSLPKMTDANARQFIRAIKAAGKKVGLYGSLSGFPSLGQDYNWIAAWRTTPPSLPWQLWQYQGSPLDRDRFAGDRAALRRFAGRPDPVPTPTPVKRMRAAAGTYRTYRVAAGTRLTTAVGYLKTRGFSATCVWLTGRTATGTIALIRLTSGVYKGKVLHRKAKGITTS